MMKAVFQSTRQKHTLCLLLALCLLLSLILTGCGNEAAPSGRETAACSVAFYAPVTSGEAYEICAMQRTQSGLAVLCRVGSNPYTYELITLNDDLTPAGANILSEDVLNHPVAFAEGDSLLLWWQDDSANLGVVEQDGEVLFETTFSSDASLLQNSEGLVFAFSGGQIFTQCGELPLPSPETDGNVCYAYCIFEQEGAVYAILAEQSQRPAGWETVGNYLCRLDSENALVLGEKLPLETDITAACALDGTLYFVSRDVVYSYADGLLSTVASLISLGIRGDCVVWMEARQDGSLLLALKDSLALLTPDADTGTRLLRIATYGSEAPSMLADAITSFNRSSTDFKADLIVFSSLETLNLSIASGEQYDLICTGDVSTLRSYAEKGVLAPLDDMALLQSEELFQNILDACRTEDGLYYFPPFPCLSGIVTPESIEIGSIDSLFACSEENHIYLYSYKESVLTSLLQDGISPWLDQPDGFLDESFLRLLEYCNGYCSLDNVEMQQMIEGAVPDWKKLQFSSISSKSDIYWADQDYFSMGKKAVWHPSPFSPYSGLVIQDAGFGYVGVCEGGSMEDAEMFLEYLLSEQYYEMLGVDSYPVSSYPCFPLRKLTQTFSGNTGERLYALVESADHLGGVSQEVTRIIYEETGAYFSGDIDVTTCAQRIQSRVDIYLAEQGD